MNVSEPFILRPVATTLLMVAILLAGASAFRLLPLATLPAVDYPTIQVQTFYPGGSPEVMTSAVTAPLEVQLGQMQGLNQMLSASSGGASIITLQFNLDITLDVAEQEVQAAINAANNLLPADLPAPPIYAKVNPADAPILTLAVTSKTLSLIDLEDLSETRLAQKISQQPGVGLVSISGGHRPAVRVQINPRALAAYGLNIDDVRTIIGNATVDMPKGNFDGPAQASSINANDQLITADEYKAILIAYRNGNPVRLSDVANVIKGPENRFLAAWSNRTPAIILNIQRQPGANVIQVADSIKRLLPQIKANLPTALELDIINDRTTTIRASVADVEFELGLAVVLVVLVIFVFLRTFAATLIPSLSAPLSLIGCLGVMYLLRFSLDNLSLMALTISTGFVVDDAIVVLENITRYVEHGENPFRAALRGAGEVGFTVLSISMSLIAVLIPLLLMSGLIGRLFREFAVTLAMTIVVSAVVSLTLTPMMASRFLRDHTHDRHSRLFMMCERGFAALANGYARGLDAVLRHRAATLMVFLATLAATVYLFVIIPKGFFPQQDTGVLFGTSDAPQDVSFAQMMKLQEQLGAIVQADPDVATVGMALGSGVGSSAQNSGRMFITLKPREERKADAFQIIARLRPKLAQVNGAHLYLQVAQDVTVGARFARTQFQYTLQDADSDELNLWAPKVLAKFGSLPELRDVATDQQNAGATLHLTIDRNMAARFGIQPQLIDDTLYDAYGQRQVAQYFTQVNTYDVIEEIRPDLQGDPKSLDLIYIRSPSSGQMVPLSAFAKWTTTPVAPLSISHQSQFPAVTISFNLAPGMALGQATEAVQQAERDLRLPPTLSTTFQGNAQAFQESLTTVPLLILAALVVVYIILGILYESFIHPLTILSTLPSAGFGALATLMAFGYEFSLIALIGLILLIGIVKKNGIMMVDFAIAAERDEHLTTEQAIRKAALLRFRPIMMTTMAAMLGGVPLMLGQGTGSELRQPLGYTMVGGLLFSQALTLFTTPVIYLYLDQLSNRLWRRAKHPEGEATPDMAGSDDQRPAQREAAE